MCSANDHPPYDPLTESPRVIPASNAGFICEMIEQAIHEIEMAGQPATIMLIGATLAARGWKLVNTDEDGCRE